MMAIILEKRYQMRGYIMANSGIPTLDASNLTYEFEQDARNCCFYDIL